MAFAKERNKKLTQADDFFPPCTLEPYSKIHIIMLVYLD